MSNHQAGADRRAEAERPPHRLSRSETAVAAAAAAGTFGLIVGEGMPAVPRIVLGVGAAVFWVGFALRVAVPPAAQTPVGKIGSMVLHAVHVREPLYLICPQTGCGRPFVVDLTDQHVAAVTCRHMSRRVETRPGIESLTPNRDGETMTIRLSWPAEVAGTFGQPVTTTHQAVLA